MTFDIESSANPLIKRLMRLSKRRERESSGLFLIEGLREVSRAADAGVTFDRILVAPELASDRHDTLVARLDESTVVTVSATAMQRLSRRESPDAVIAVAMRSPIRLDDIALSEPPLLLVAESIEKPGNLGAMVRSSDALGADAVISVDPRTDWENPNVIRASQGSVFAMATPTASAGELHGFLRDRAITLIALMPEVEAAPLWDVDLTGPVALAVGAEDRGLSDRLAAGGLRARVPMRGTADSLNASVTAGLALYEAARQRRARG